jgi:signal peptidase I
VDARCGDFRGRIDLDYHVFVSAGAGGRHEHVASAGDDRLFINKFVYRIAPIHRGDVVVFHYPRDPEKSYIKRVIALPGDHLAIDRGQVWLDGKPLDEAYVPEEYRDTRSLAEIVVPADTYFMMGDHRSISSDSREFGPVERDLIYGKAVFVYWPTRDAGVVR